MPTLSFLVPPEWAGRPVKEFAKKHLGLSARVLAQGKRLPGGITLNGQPVFVTAPLKAGDELSFSFEEEPCPYPPAPLPLPILYEDESLLVADKPSAMPVHPSPGHDRDSLVNAVAFHYQQTGQSHLIRPLYRLDKDTSGLIALGKHRAAVSSATVEKRYLAICQGVLSGGGTIDCPIGLAPGSKIQRCCGQGERAVTHWKALAAGEGHTLLLVRLETGRTHQIRAHFAHMGHPLAGDDLYGGCLERVCRQALHCAWLSLSSRALGLYQKQFTSDLPLDLRRAFPWVPPLGELLQGGELCQPV